MAGDPVGHDAVDAECRTFSRYLTGDDPSDYVVACYRRLLPSASISPGAGSVLIERTLLALARRGTVPSRLADGYARWFRPRAVLRRRLVLLLAILENSPSGERRLNSGEEGSVPGVIARLLVAMAASGVCVVMGVLCLGPVHIASVVMTPDPLSEGER